MMQLNQLHTTVYVAVGLVGLLTIAALCLTVFNGCKKAFGKQPPMHEQIKALREELIHAAAKHEAEDVREVARLEGLIAGVDKDVRQLRQDIVTNGEMRKNHILDVINNVRLELDRKFTEQTRFLIGALKGKND